MKIKNLHFSWTKFLIFIIILASVVRCYNKYFFVSSSIEVLILLSALIVLLVKKRNSFFKNKKSIFVSILLLLCVSIALMKYNPLYYSQALYYMYLIALFCYFIGLFYGEKIYSLFWLIVFHGGINAVVTWIQVINYSFYETYFQRFINQDLISSINKIYFQFGGLCGMTDHYSRNAFFIVSAMIVLFSFYLCENDKDRKWGYLAGSGFFFLTLMTIGKRSHLVISFFVLLVVYLIAQKNIKKIFKKGIWALIFVSVSLALLLTFVPSSRNTVMRIINSINDGSTDISTGRVTQIYPVAWKLFLSNPIFGNGFGYFSTYTKQAYSGVHNDYLQWLCEYGVVGFSVYFIFLMSSLVMIFRFFRRTRRKFSQYGFKVKVMATWSLIFQMWMLIYSLTGIPHYDYEISILYYLACGVGIYLLVQERKWKRVSYEEQNSNSDIV